MIGGRGLSVGNQVSDRFNNVLRLTNCLMTKICISRETRENLLKAASSGQRIEPWLFNFTRSDKEFQAELIRKAEESINTVFFDCLQEFLSSQKCEYDKAYGKSECDKIQKASGFVGKWVPKGKDAKLKKQPSKPVQRGVGLNNKKPQSEGYLFNMKRSVNYNPTGISFEEFLKQKGLFYPPNYKPPFVKFVPGGAVGSNRKRC